MDNDINDYILNFLTNQETPEDLEKLKQWLTEDPSNHEKLKQWFVTYTAAGMLNDKDELSARKAYGRFLYKLNRDSLGTARKKDYSHRVKLGIMKIAAVAVISFSLGIGVHLLSIHKIHKPYKETAYIENIVPLGATSKIVLPDGTSIWLNAGSRLRYSADYGVHSRDIYLEGEGYFKVAHQDIPFVVKTSLMDVKALGTEFNVKAYPDEDVVETTLISGKVSISKEKKIESENRSVILMPGQKYTILRAKKSDYLSHAQDSLLSLDKRKGQEIRQLSPTMAEAEVSWKERNWCIEREKLQALVIKLERRYDVSIIIDEGLRNYHFSGTIKDESIEQVLNAMSLTAPISFTIKGKQVYIHEDRKKIMN